MEDDMANEGNLSWREQVSLTYVFQNCKKRSGEEVPHCKGIILSSPVLGQMSGLWNQGQEVITSL